MDLSAVAKTFLALGFVIGIIYLSSYLLRKIGEKGIGFKMPTNKNIKLEEIMPIDTSRRIAVVKYLNKKYVLLLGTQDAVIDVINIKK